LRNSRKLIEEGGGEVFGFDEHILQMTGNPPRVTDCTGIDFFVASRHFLLSILYQMARLSEYA
jgi:hypothetical protein